jgi:hypothetical protein
VGSKVSDSRNEAPGAGEVPDYLALPRGPFDASIETMNLVVRSRTGSPIADPVSVVVGSSIVSGLSWPECHGYITGCVRGQIWKSQLGTDQIQAAIVILYGYISSTGCRAWLYIVFRLCRWYMF